MSSVGVVDFVKNVFDYMCVLYVFILSHILRKNSILTQQNICESSSINSFYAPLPEPKRVVLTTFQSVRMYPFLHIVGDKTPDLF